MVKMLLFRLKWVIKKIIRFFLPSIIIGDLGSIWYKLSARPVLEYAPDGWETVLKKDPAKRGWNAEDVIRAEEAMWEVFCVNLKGNGPLGFSHEHDDLRVVRNIPFHNVHITYAYVLAIAAQGKNSISVLDFGGALGHYYQLGKAVLPGVALDFHCREVPLMVEAGRKANPDVHWYADESYQNRTYDLVMINGSLQYIRDWAGVLRQLARLVAGYLLLTRIPIVESGPSFLAVQRIYNTELLHQQFNQGAVLGVMESTGLERVREFVVGDRPYIKNAPEQCELRGWLFKK